MAPRKDIAGDGSPVDAGETIPFFFYNRGRQRWLLEQRRPQEDVMAQDLTTRVRRVVLCDQEGNPSGEMGVLEAHQGGGRLHRAFSVFVFRDRGPERELLIQERSSSKRLFSKRWANSCCSHLTPEDDDVRRAARLRLREECGIDIPLRDVGSFVYQAADPISGCAEHEHDTVLVGNAAPDIQVRANPAEISDWAWVTKAELDRRLQETPDAFAPWFVPALRIAWA